MPAAMPVRFWPPGSITATAAPTVPLRRRYSPRSPQPSASPGRGWSSQARYQRASSSSTAVSSRSRISTPSAARSAGPAPRTCAAPAARAAAGPAPAACAAATPAPCVAAARAPCATSSEVAVGTGSSPRCWRTLIPVPITIALPQRSARTPAILAPSTSTSFGHFSRASTPAVRCRADATATPASNGIQPSRPAGTAGRRSTEKVRARRGGLIHRRPIRPRPEVCASATSTRPSAAPERAWDSRSALVDPVSSTTLTSRHRPGRDASAPFSLAASSTGRPPSSPGSESVVITQSRRSAR